MDTQRKLELLADASRYDLSCACGTKDGDHRRRGPDGMWLYPVSLPSGGVSIMLKTLLSNSCINDCRYCPLRNDQDVRRCSLTPEEIATVFMDYVRQRKVVGLFLSSGVSRSPDYTMDRMTGVAWILRRRYRYRGYIHLKVIPGASDAAIETALSLASAVSLNVEAPKPSAFAALSKTKDYDRHIVQPIKLISRLTSRGNQFAGVKQTTQFIVGAADESDSDIVRATFGLYRRLGLSRVYFSAYQRGLGDPSLPGEQNRTLEPEQMFTREHRLYQADFLLRQYKWDIQDILFDADGKLPLGVDPKQRWAELHPEFFPVRVLSAGRDELLRVPGLGPTTAKRILQSRRQGGIRSLADVGMRGKRLANAKKYTVME
ncbi:MAG: radical SAM protein [Phycisphaerae bacterium]|nr:radical SAM protein [Phycisphaerae bacterium]